MYLNVVLDDERLFTEMAGPVLYLRTEKQFFEYFQSNPLGNGVNAIFFDHDLGKKGGSAIKCARLLVDLVHDRNFSQQINCYVHSMNPVGGSNLVKELEGWFHTQRISLPRCTVIEH